MTAKRDSCSRPATHRRSGAAARVLSSAERRLAGGSRAGTPIRRNRADVGRSVARYADVYAAHVRRARPTARA